MTVLDFKFFTKLLFLGGLLLHVIVAAKDVAEGDNDDEIYPPVNIPEIIAKCLEEHPFDFAIVHIFQNTGQIPDENAQEPKCFMRCVFQNARFVSLEDGSYDTVAIGHYMSGFRGKANMTQPILTQLADSCVAKSDHRDMCQRNYNFEKCLYQEQIKYYGPGNYSKDAPQ